MDLITLKTHRLALIEEAQRCPSGLSWCYSYSSWMDDLVREMFESTARTSDLRGICMVATGGYGRRELAPWSDVDLSILVREEALSQFDQHVRDLHRLLFDTLQSGLGVHLGYAYHYSGDASGLDGKSRTGMLDMRWLAGDTDVEQEFRSSLVDSFMPGQFLIEKLSERQASVKKSHDTPLVVEPNLKEGRGGLRDFHFANWLRFALGIQPLRPHSDYETVITFRNALHSLSGRPNDCMTRQKQADLADAWSSTPFDLGSELAKAMGVLEENYREAVDLLQEVRFDLSPGVFALRGEARLKPETNLSDAANGLAIAHQLGLRVMRQTARLDSAQVDPSILDSLGSGESAIRDMDRSGLLEAMLPELTACRTLLPRDSAHTFTVFEHSLRVVRYLEVGCDTPFLKEVRHGFDQWELLVLATLLHDVGKIDPTEPHADVGARIAKAVCERWRLGKHDSEFVIWLVEHHLALDRTIRFRDVFDPDVVREFASLVGSTAHLNALTLLTWADVHAVAEDMWTPSQDEAMQVLYAATLHALGSQETTAPDGNALRKRLSTQLQSTDVEQDALETFLASLSTSYVVATPPEIVKLHAVFFQSALQGQTMLEFSHRPEVGTSELTVCMPDRPGLLSQLMGVLYALDLTLHTVKVHTTNTQPAVALDQFTVSFGANALPEATCRRVIATIQGVLDGEVTLETVFENSGKDILRDQEQATIQFVEGRRSMLEIRAPKGRGLGFRMSRWITSQGWNIRDARFGQWAGRGAATFVIETSLGQPVTREAFESARQARV